MQTPERKHARTNRAKTLATLLSDFWHWCAPEPFVDGKTADFEKSGARPITSLTLEQLKLIALAGRRIGELGKQAEHEMRVRYKVLNRANIASRYAAIHDASLVFRGLRPDPDLSRDQPKPVYRVPMDREARLHAMHLLIAKTKAADVLLADQRQAVKQRRRLAQQVYQASLRRAREGLPSEAPR